MEQSAGPVSSHAEAAAPAPPLAAGPQRATGLAATVLALQQSAGNRAVRQLLQRAPADPVSGATPAAPATAPSPPAAQRSRFTAFLLEQLRLAAALEDPVERAQEAETLRRMSEWLDRNEGRPELMKRGPESIYAELWVDVIGDAAERTPDRRARLPAGRPMLSARRNGTSSSRSPRSSCSGTRAAPSPTRSRWIASART